MIRKTFCILACFAAAACAPIGSKSNLEQRVDAQDIQLQQMQPQQADTWNQVQAMREEIAQLKGEIASMRQSQLGTTASVGTQLSQEPVTGIVPRPDAWPDSSAYSQNQPTSPGPAGNLATAAPVTPQGNYGLTPEPAQTQAVAPSEENWGKADPQPQQVEVPKKDISLALFDAGVNDFNARNYPAAQRSFQDFLKNYPNHSQVADAQYYLAECKFQSNQFPEAALAYDEVIKKYPKSSKAPAAYYKQGVAFSKMKQTAAASARMQELIKKFPNSAEAARAKTFLKTNK